MAFDLHDVPVTIGKITPCKKGKEDDAPLGLSMDMLLEGPAKDFLPYFHPTLSHFLYHEGSLRFNGGFNRIDWIQSMLNMEITLSGITIYGDMSKFKLVPFIDEGEEEADYRNCIKIQFTAKVGQIPPGNIIGLLSELMNTQAEATIQPSQLSIEEVKEASSPKKTEKPKQDNEGNVLKINVKEKKAQ